MPMVLKKSRYALRSYLLVDLLWFGLGIMRLSDFNGCTDLNWVLVPVRYTDKTKAQSKQAFWRLRQNELILTKWGEQILLTAALRSMEMTKLTKV